MGWTFFFLMVVLKLPILALLYLVWWSVNAKPDSETDGSDEDGGVGRPNGPRRTRPRGPHGEPPPPSPARTRRPQRPASRPVRP